MSTTNKKDALGKGIRSLLQNIDADLKNTAGNLKSEIAEQASVSMRIALENKRPLPSGGMVFTDDKAPIERITNQMVLSNILTDPALLGEDSQ